MKTPQGNATKVIGLNLAIAVIAGYTLIGCGTSPEVSGVDQKRDTVFLNVSRVDIVFDTVFQYIWPGKNGPDTSIVHSDSVSIPEIDSLRIPGSPGIMMRPTFRSEPEITVTCIRHPGAVSIDTIVRINPNNKKHIILDTITRIMPLSMESYSTTTIPFFIGKPDLVSSLSEIPEGFFRRYKISGFHYTGDSAIIRLENKPSWVNLKWWGRNYRLHDSRIYSRCKPETLFPRRSLPPPDHGDGWDRPASDPYLEVYCDSTHVDSTYTWKLIVENRFHHADTISFSSYCRKDSCLSQ